MSQRLGVDGSSQRRELFRRGNSGPPGTKYKSSLGGLHAQRTGHTLIEMCLHVEYTLDGPSPLRYPRVVSRERGTSQRSKCASSFRVTQKCVGDSPRPNKNTKAPRAAGGGGGAGDPEEVVLMRKPHDANLFARSGND